MLRYTIPGMTEFPEIVLLMLSFQRDAPELFYDDVKIESVYGGFPSSSFCGGRCNTGPAMPLLDVEAVIDRYNDLGIDCNVTFSNQLLDEAAISGDEYSRQILWLLDNGAGNGAILHSEALDAYVRSEHPSLKRISSTTKCLKDTTAIQKELARFDRVVLDNDIAHDPDALSALRDRDKLEVMVNEYCVLGCPHREEHYRAISENQLAGTADSFACRQKATPQAFGFCFGMMDGEGFFHVHDVNELSERFSIHHFKIVGRGLDRYDLIDSLLYYLIRPGHWYSVRDYLVHRGYV